MSNPHYQHDMMHCSQEQCPNKDKCYRYWLGQNIGDSGFRYASFYLPDDNKDLSNCDLFMNIKDY